ncbi:MAG: hypothetical protein LUD47_02830, partial [Clostridia bacterium]|nr:hypothetical protein [Clostridia bacterium]
IQYENTSIEDILTDDELPGPIHLMHDEGWNYDELLEEKIGILEHDGRLCLIGQPKRFAKTGRMFKRIAADGREFEIPEYALENFGGLDLFSIDRKKETLRKLNDLDFIDTLLDEFLCNLCGD